MKSDRLRQETIQRLQSFLKDSINLEPELEAFIASLISLLEYPVRYVDKPESLPSPESGNKFTKVQH